MPIAKSSPELSIVQLTRICITSSHFTQRMFLPSQSARRPTHAAQLPYSCDLNVEQHSARASVPRGITAVGIFLLFGAAMASPAGTTLVWQGSALDSIWSLNPHAHKELAPFAGACPFPEPRFPI